MHLGLLALGLIASTSLAASSSQTIELDLVFPRNDTYAPLAYFPIILAVQNTDLAWSLGATLQYYLFNFDSNDTLRGNSYVHSGNSSADPFFWIDYTSRTNNTNGAWRLYWQLDLPWNCSETNGSYSADQYYHSPRGELYFTTASDGKQPDFESSACPTALTIEVKEVLNNTDVKNYHTNGDACAVISGSATSGTPCAARLGDSEVGNITSALHGWSNCPYGTFENVTQDCTEDSVENSATPSKYLGVRSWIALAAGFVSTAMIGL